MTSMAASLERRGTHQPDAEALVFEDLRLTNAELLSRVRVLARALAREGIGRGDIVALLMQNRTEFLELVYATGALGAVFLPLNFRLAPDEWSYIVGHAGAKMVVTEPAYEDAVASIAAETAGVEQCWTVGDVAYGDRLAAAADDPLTEFADVGLGDIQRLMYTSGTTSRPKGVPLTYGNLHWKNVGHIVEFGLTSADRTLIAGPLYHVGGFDLPVTGVLYVGGSVVVLPRFDAAAVLRTIEAERITNVWLPPAMVNAILALPERKEFDTSSLRFIISGGEKMPEPLVERIVDQFPGTWFADAYGLTETVSGDTFLDPEHTFSKIGSVGRAVAHLEMRIVDDDGNVLPPDTTGEICLRGPKVFAGYWRDPDATERALRDGWFHTGDVGRIDADGYLYVEDRKKDLIISGGENIASPEVERVLYEHPGVLEAAVIGIPDERWGEVPMAFVVPRGDGGVEAGELVAFCTERLAKFKVPKRVDFIDVLPRTPSGKVLKRTLRETLKEGTAT